MDPAFHVVERERQRERVGQIQENSGRLAQSFVTYVTTGHGEIVVPDPLVFDTTFLTEPNISSGAVVDRMPNLEWFKMPRVNANVLRWQRDDRRHYTGAWIYITVDCPPRELGPEATDAQRLELRTYQAENPPTPRIVHHLGFRGVAYKKLSQRVRDQIVEQVT